MSKNLFQRNIERYGVPLSPKRIREGAYAVMAMFLVAFIGSEIDHPSSRRQPSSPHKPAADLRQLSHGTNRSPLDGCNFGLAKSQLRDLLVDQRSFTANVLSSQSQPASAILMIGKQALVNPIILECKDRPIAVAGLDDPLKMETDSTYDPVRIYSLNKLSSGGTLPSGMDTMNTTLKFYNATSGLDKRSGFSVVAQYEGLAGTDGLTYSLMLPLKYAGVALELSSDSSTQSTQTPSEAP